MPATAGRLVAGCCAAAALAYPPAASAADRELTVSAETPQQWVGRVAVGGDPSPLDPATLFACRGSLADVCDTTLVHVQGEGTLGIDLKAREGTPDVDLYVLRDDTLVAVSAGPSAAETIDVPAASGDYLVRAVSLAFGTSGFDGSATLTPRAAPPVIDGPRGLPEELVSDPRAGVASQPAVAADGDEVYAAYRVFADPGTYVSRLATAMSDGHRWHALGAPSPAEAANPALAVSDGTPLLAANEKTDGRWSVTLRRRGHRSWGPANVLSLPPAGTDDERPVLAAHRDEAMACWNRTTVVGAYTRQGVLCRHSSDGGRTWRAATQPTPAAIPGVPYGPYVGGVALTHHAGAFTVAWVDTHDPARADTAWTATSRDGATWSAPVRAAAFTAPPDRFPGVHFRNVELLTLAASRGHLYLAYAAAGPVVKVTRSDDAGAHWTAPVTAGDGFQPSLAVTRGRVVVSYLSLLGEYADERLATSHDRGVTWRERRLSRAVWDPAIGAPHSPTGDLLGDHQALAATRRGIVALAADPHLSVVSGAQLFAWRVN